MKTVVSLPDFLAIAKNCKTVFFRNHKGQIQNFMKYSYRFEILFDRLKKEGNAYGLNITYLVKTNQLILNY